MFELKEKAINNYHCKQFKYYYQSYLSKPICDNFRIYLSSVSLTFLALIFLLKFLIYLIFLNLFLTKDFKIAILKLFSEYSGQEFRLCNDFLNCSLPEVVLTFHLRFLWTSFLLPNLTLLSDIQMLLKENNPKTYNNFYRITSKN